MYATKLNGTAQFMKFSNLVIGKCVTTESSAQAEKIEIKILFKNLNRTFGRIALN